MYSLVKWPWASKPKRARERSLDNDLNCLMKSLERGPPEVDKIRFRPLKDQYKLLRVEKKFMNALIKDIEYVSDLGKKIDKKAHQLWDSQQRPGATVQLSDVEKEWISAIEAVVRKAKSCCQNYQRLSRRRQFPRKISGLRTEIDAVNDEIISAEATACFRMETKTEKAWVKLVEETILELLQDKDGILKIANRMSWIFYIGN
ncbi:hypothetical protein CFP56_033782 [Quercus suber]|uniref:Uncharacterized protein n=1 Tax=Quercus suber TaxID=58331 RepID=A0AAW0LTP0_QUESU